jgi:hypothetical protein
MMGGDVTVTSEPGKGIGLYGAPTGRAGFALTEFSALIKDALSAQEPKMSREYSIECARLLG